TQQSVKASRGTFVLGGGGVSGISGFGSDDAFISAPLQDPSRAELQARDAALWRDTESRLSDILRRSAGAAMRKGLLSAQRYHAYLCSVTEAEIEMGVLSPPSPARGGGGAPNPPTRPHRAAECCSVFVREARGVAACVPASERARVFVDAERGPDGAFRVDAEAQALLRSLKRRLRAHGGGGGGIRGPPAGSEAAPRARLVVYQVEWSEGMVDSAVESHRRYLDSVCRTFTAELKRQITRCVEAARRAQAPDDRLLQELGHHAAQCERKSRGLCGRAALMATLWSRLHERRRGAGGHPPVVVFGPSGTGKTSVLAELVRQAPEQLGEEAVVAARLLGTSPLSSDIHAVLRGLCLQLCLAYERERPPAHVLNVYADTVRFFHRLLASVGEQPQAPPLLLVLDSLDQLSGTDGAHRLHWLPKRYAASVLVVVSTLPSEHGILDALRAAVHDADAYLEVEPLMPENGGEMMEGLLRAAGRTLAGEQRALLLAAFARCGQPLFVRLAFDEARRWRSFAPLGVELRGRVASDTREAVHALYARLEAQHGRALVAHALGFVVASRSGLSEVELKDCLSLDDAVLADVYQYWSPPNRDMVRLPPLLWTRLRHDLADYLVDRQADGHTVIALYHRQFVEAVQERYLQGEERRLLHQTLADYFGGSWAGGRRKTIHLSQRGEVLHADRKVAAQPLRFGEDKVNLRKLSELPFHLAHAGRHQQLREEIFGSVEWLSLKLSALGVKALLEDFALALELQPCAETQLVHDAMLLIRPTLEFMENGVDESVFFVELLARLEYFERRYPTMVGRLCAQCRQLCQTRPEPILLPLWGCLQPPGGPLRTTLTGFGQGVSVLALSASGRVMAAGSLDGTIIVWDLQEDEATHTLTGHAGEVLSLVLGRRADLLVSFGRDSTARVWSLVTGKEVTLVSTAPAGPNVPSGSSGSTGPTSSATAALGKEEEEDEVSYSLIVVSEEREEFHLFTNSTLHSFSLWSGAPLLSEPLGGRSRCHALGGDGEGAVAVVTAAAAAADGGDADDGGCCPGGGVRVSLVEPGAGLLKRRLDAWVPGPAGPAGRPVCVAVAGPGLLLAGLAGGTLLTVSLEAGGCCRSTEALGAEPRFIAVSPDCTLAAVGVDKRVCVFDLRGAGEAPARRAVEPRHQDRVEAAVFSGCTALISASLDETIKVWDLRDGLTLRECIEGMGMAVTALCLAADGILVSASRQAYYLKVWDVGERRLRGDPGGGSAGGLLSPPFHDRSGLVALTVDAATVVLQDMEEPSRVVLWDTRTGAPRQLVSCPAHVTSVDCARARDLIVIGLSSGLVLALTPQLDSAESGREGAVPPADAPWAVAAELGVAGAVSVTCLALGAGDSRLAVGLSSNRVTVHCTKTWLCQCVLEAACRGALSAVALLPGLAGAMWGSDSGQLGLALRRPPTPAGTGDREPASSPVTEGSSRTKDRADDGGAVGEGGERCVELEGYGTRVSCVLLSPGGRYAFAGCDGTLQRLWCARTWQVLHEYTYQGAFYQGVTSAAFSPEERFLFTGSRDRSIKVWCVVTGILLKVQYVYATVTRVIAMETRGGPSGEQLGPEARPAWACLVLACTRLGYVLRLEFRCPPRLAPGYDPLRYIKASSSVCSRRPSALGGPCREQAEAVPEAAARAEWTRGLQDDHGGSGAVGATRGHEEAAVPGRRGGSSRTCALL
ncbi:NACHT domain- and WD repeat-containing protein 1, partial [Petromyzon marinus]|uniref:NACHT domain- and WD repeat-containing protein 1 n=1 Tax=Petromyzon marinus TaxID=7757 RepID=UPI003F726DD0